jgi:tRNA G37 N-methylase TrmD
MENKALHIQEKESTSLNGFLPELMTEDELIEFLRIPEVTNSGDYHNVIEHLKRARGLPRIHICRKALYPKKAILGWVEKETGAEK